MGKTKANGHRSKPSTDAILHQPSAHVKSTGRKSKPIAVLLEEAASLLDEGQPDAALPLAQECMRRLQSEQPPPSTLPNSEYTTTLLQLTAQEKPTLPQAVVLVAETYLALGETASASTHFEAAVRLDPVGQIISADPLCNLAQLCDEGGAKSIEYFERGCQVLRNEIEGLKALQPAEEDDEHVMLTDMKQAQLADVLCGMAEVYMTDLSWEADAEQKCENYVTEALAICPEAYSAGTLAALANVRISQERVDEAREALRRSLAVWEDIPAELESESRPDFASRVSLSRLLMEVGMLDEAMGVIEGLLGEDDESVETSYLAGWCQVLMAEGEEEQGKAATLARDRARAYIATCLRLYQAQGYEDEKLRDHALELRHSLNKELGVENGEEEWEDEEDEDIDGDVEVIEEDGANGFNHHNGGDGDVDMT
jgi:tetratricopeptide (TPR) repeat protein